MVNTSFPGGGVSSVNGARGDVVVGGRNLLLNTDFTDGMSHWGDVPGNPLTTKEVKVTDNLHWLHLAGRSTQQNTSPCGMSQTTNGNSRGFHVTPGMPYTLSALAYGEGEGQWVYVNLRWGTKDGDRHIENHFIGIPLPGKPAVISETRTAPENADTVRVSFSTGWETAGTEPHDDNETNEFYLTHVKLEQGSIATDWAPAPEEILARIAALEAKANA